MVWHPAIDAEHSLSYTSSKSNQCRQLSIEPNLLIRNEGRK